jgi:RHS repeat-associated protein
VIFHAAGLAGVGQSSYIDSVILRDLDNAAWTAAASETLDQRRYILQNWRADVIATTQLNGDPSEYVRYSPYGVATSYPVADINRDGSINSTDSTDWNSGTPQNSAVIGNDLNKDGTFTTADTTLFTSEYNATTKRGGYTKLGTADAGPSLRIGYAGYQFDPAIKMYHVRHRVYDPGVGRWTRRDPLGYVDGVGLVNYVSSDPISKIDSDGLRPCPIGFYPATITAYWCSNGPCMIACVAVCDANDATRRASLSAFVARCTAGTTASYNMCMAQGPCPVGIPQTAMTAPCLALHLACSALVAPSILLCDIQHLMTLHAIEQAYAGCIHACAYRCGAEFTGRCPPGWIEIGEKQKQVCFPAGTLPTNPGDPSRLLVPF